MTFEEAVAIVLDLEGGYVNNIHDPGGETNYGICKKYHPDVDIKNLTRFEAMKIYKKEYWEPMNLDIFPDSMRLILFDCAVNQGLSKAKQFSCNSLGVNNFFKIEESLFSGFTQEEIIKCVDRIAKLRMNAYTESKHWNDFGDGWTERLEHIVSLT